MGKDFCILIQCFDEVPEVQLTQSLTAMNSISESGSASHNVKLDTAQISVQIDNLIALQLHLWDSLSAAISNNWGTASASGEDKRSWLAGSLSELFASNQIRDIEDLEDILEQVMSDEFEVVVDDGSLEQIASKIWQGRQKLLQGDSSEVTKLMTIWEEKQEKRRPIQLVQGPEVNQDTDDEGSEASWNGFQEEQDTDMGEAPALIDTSKREKIAPEVDEDGFTKVVPKKKR